MNKVLAVGQVPPPWGGQAVMIRKLLDADLPDVELHFVPMAFSADMDEIGRFRWKKLFQLPVLVGNIWRSRFRTGCRILYYPPGGESITAICRDAFVLLCCRLIFKKTVFHVHAGGFTEVAANTPLPVRLMAMWAYRKPDLVIQLTDKSPPDAAQIKARKTVSVPNGLADAAAGCTPRSGKKPEGPVKLLFVGVVGPSKGVAVLLDACAELERQRVDFLISIVGRFYSPEFEKECRSVVEQHGLENKVRFEGVVIGNAKWELFSQSDIFCFPTHFESENQSLVILEAMQFGLPCIASDWRGISSMVEDGVNGFLVPIREPLLLADRIEELIGDAGRRAEMGRRSRERYCEAFTDDRWTANMNRVLKEL